MNRDDIRYGTIWRPIYTKYETCPMNQWAHIKTYKIRPKTYEIKYDTEEIRNKRTGHILKNNNGYVTLDINKKINGKYLRRKFRIGRICWNSWNRNCMLPCEISTYIASQVKDHIPMMYFKKYKEWELNRILDSNGLISDNKVKDLYNKCSYYTKKEGY